MAPNIPAMLEAHFAVPLTGAVLNPLNYRLDPATGAATVVADGIEGPNGLCFSPDETKLYVVESASRPRRTWVFDVDGDKLKNKRPFADCGPGGSPDGWRVDERGNVVGVVSAKLSARAALAALDPGGLEPLACSAEALRERLGAANHTLKRALTDPHLFSGIGNAYSD